MLLIQKLCGLVIILQIATVDSDGKVTAGAVPGNATITVTTVDGAKKANCTIKVTQPVTGIKLTPSSDTLNTKSQRILKATITPSNATNTEIKWTSSNTKIATVTNGLVKTLNVPGTVYCQS